MRDGYLKGVPIHGRPSRDLCKFGSARRLGAEKSVICDVSTREKHTIGLVRRRCGAYGKVWLEQLIIKSYVLTCSSLFLPIPQLEGINSKLTPNATKTRGHVEESAAHRMVRVA